MIFTALLILFLLQTAAPGGTANSIVFDFENPQLQPAKYSIEIHEDGSGRYKSMPSPPTPGTTTPDTADAYTSQPMDREIRIGDSLRTQLFALARSHHFFAIACESPKNHVAFTGKKTLSYSGGGGQGSCTYNYSKDEQLNRIADEMESVAFTIEEGQKLALQHEHSPLALDAELETLQDSARGGRALEMGNIAPQLQSIADDANVLERARKRARELLGSSKPAGAS